MSDLTRSRRDVLRGAVVAVGAAAAAVPAGLAGATTAERTIALTGVTVIDGTGRSAVRDQTVLVRGERVVALGHRIPVPEGAEVLDLRGKFVIPGLCDAHVHSLPAEPISPPLYLVNGVTTVREMSGSPLLHEWRDRVERGELLGPRSVIASRIIDGAPALGGEPMFDVVATEAQARAAVRRADREGADFVKVYSRLPEDLYRVIVDETRRRRIPFAGHCPDAVPLEAASRAGQRSVEHLYSAWYDTSTREPELRARIAELSHAPGDYLTWSREIHRLEWDAVTSYSPRKAARLFATLARDRTRLVPTLTVYQVLDRPDEVDQDDERLQYVPASVVKSWRWAMENIIIPGRTPEEAAQRHELLDRRLAFVGDAAAAGVPVVAGTDGGDVPFVVPAFGLHDELATLVRAGLSPLRALRAATLDAARLLGLDDELGTVAPGRAADLVVLDADPLTDIRNTTRIHAVLTRGRVISADRRAQLLADIATAAAAG